MHVGDCSFSIWRIHEDDISGTAICHDCRCQYLIFRKVYSTHIAYSWAIRAPELVHKRQIFLGDGPR